MHVKRFSSALMLGAAIFITSSAYATMSVPYGWYAEANVGPAKLSNSNYGNLRASTNGVGYSGHVGYKFMPFFSTEIFYARYPDTTLKNSVGTKLAYDQRSSYGIAGKGILPISNSGAEVFAKVGAQRLAVKHSVDNSVAIGTSRNFGSIGLYLGVGGQYYIMPEMAAIVQWARSKGSSSSSGTMDLYSVGISFIFD